MIDMMLHADLDDRTTIHVSPIAPETYEDYVESDNLGGHNGYFILQTRSTPSGSNFQVLAKAPSEEAATNLFDLIVGTWKHCPSNT